jgi:hypothetical protein
MAGINTLNEGTQSHAAIARLPLGLRISGTVIFIGSAMLTARLIWERTVWTWEFGPQNEGYSLAHGYGAILFLFPMLLVVWSAIVVVLTIRSRIRKNQITPTRWVALGLVAALLVVGALPDGFWQRVFISRMAASSYAGDLLMYAAARGDFSTVRAFVSRGVPVDATDHAYKETALHAVAASGNLKIIGFLVSQGANVNALDRYGDSPLELAASQGHDEAAKFLSERGAKRIRGDEAQRRKAIQEEVE